MNHQVPLSVVIITKNEEKNLPDCLESIQWAKEIILVDGFSSDRTVAIAERYTDKIHLRKMDIEGKHRNFAYSLATQEWILSLDADERVSFELAQEIKEVVKKNDPNFAGYAVPVKTFIGNRWVKAAGYYPARKLRIHRKGKFRYEETSVHPRAFLDGKEQPLKNDILHYGFRDFTHFFDKLNNQTTLEAEKWIQDNRKIGISKLISKAVDRFLRNYIGKKGFKDGFMGFLMSMAHGLYQLMTYAKYLELKKQKLRKVIFIDRDGVINEDLIGDYIKTWNDFRFIPGSIEALKKLNGEGYDIIIISNQAGIGDGIYSESALNDITNKMLHELKQNSVNVRGVYYCLHGKDVGCECRKPKTGLFQWAAKEIKFNPSETYFIGDKATDIKAGKQFGLKTLFVLTGHGLIDQAKLTPELRPEKILPSIKEAADYVLGGKSNG